MGLGLEGWASPRSARAPGRSLGFQLCPTSYSGRDSGSWASASSSSLGLLQGMVEGMCGAYWAMLGVLFCGAGRKLQAREQLGREPDQDGAGEGGICTPCPLPAGSATLGEATPASTPSSRYNQPY